MEGQWGRIHDITLSYVVVVTWDRRVLVLPCTRFTSSPFENWSKISADLSGTLELDLDWRASIPALRKQLDGLLAGTALWDGDVVRIHLTDATGGVVRARILVSAVDPATLWELRCHIREALTEWIRDEHPEWVVRHRLALSPEA